MNNMSPDQRHSDIDSLEDLPIECKTNDNNERTEPTSNYGLIRLNSDSSGTPSSISDNDNQLSDLNIQQPDGLRTIGSIAISSSSDITFGSKTIFNSPVIVENMILRSPKEFPTSCSIKNNKDAKKPRKRYIIGGIIALITIIVIAIVITLILLNIVSNGQDDFQVEFVTREAWGAAEPSEPLSPHQLPIEKVVFSHTVTGQCFTKNACIIRVKNVQQFHMEKSGYADIGYNFLIGDDGNIYVGRDFNYRGAHTPGHNNNTVGIGLIGSFNVDQPSYRLLAAAKFLLETGLKENKLSSDYKFYGQNQLVGYDSPGNNVFNIISEWPHWSLN